jgi:hypothetical protein
MTTTSIAAVAPGESAGESAPDRPPTAGRSVAARLGDLAEWAYAAVRSEALLVAVLVSSFGGRWLMADRNSYWLDELLSVNVYGRWHASALDAARYLADNSVHPPLYQLTLYYWMELFGDGERATRSLSNLFITLATLFLYLLMRDAFSRRVALAAAVVFALMYAPMYYALETRSYALTIFLVTLSSFAALRLMRAGAERGWRPALLSRVPVLLTVANVALLLTHYYNVFFWVAQGLLAGVFVLRERPPRRWPAGLGVVAALYAIQGGIFALLWGAVLADAYQRRGGAFAVEGAVRSPVELLGTVVRPNLHAPTVVAWAGSVLLLVLLIRVLVSLIGAGGAGGAGGATAQRLRPWTVAYLAGWLVAPLFVVYLVFEITGVARYSSRYWLFLVPPLAALLVLVIREGVRLAGRAGRSRTDGPHPALAAIATLAAVVLLVLPGTLAAATATKHDWRGIVRQVVDTVQADPGHRYIIYETAHRSRPMTDFYFERFSRDIRPYGTLARYEERSGEYRILTGHEPVVAQHDFLVLLFTHSRTMHFPDALDQLSRRYEVRHRQLNGAGRGFIVFDLHPDDPVVPGVEAP